MLEYWLTSFPPGVKIDVSAAVKAAVGVKTKANLKACVNANIVAKL